MRDEQRIEKILGMLKKLWRARPDERFYQMMINLGLMGDSKFWHVEDETVEKFLREKLKEASKK